jgi:hypothetical protein
VLDQTHANYDSNLIWSFFFFLLHLLLYCFLGLRHCCRPPSPFMCSEHISSGELFMCWYAVTRELCTNLRVPIQKRIANRYRRIGTRFAGFTANSVTMFLRTLNSFRPKAESVEKSLPSKWYANFTVKTPSSPGPHNHKSSSTEGGKTGTSWSNSRSKSCSQANKFLLQSHPYRSGPSLLTLKSLINTLL